MVEQVSLRTEAQKMAQKLLNDPKNTSKKNGVICKEVWKNFVQSLGVQYNDNVKFNISLENATKSIMTYARRKDNQNEIDIVQKWLNCEPVNDKGNVAGKKETKSKGNTPTSGGTQGAEGKTPTYMPKITQPKANATAEEMVKHNKAIDKYEAEASLIINGSQPSKIKAAWGSSSFAFNNLSKKNIAYVLQREPEFFEKYTKRTDLSYDQKMDDLKFMLKKVNPGVKNIDSMKASQIIEAIRKVASENPVQTKYTSQVLQNQVNKQINNDRAALESKVTIPTKPYTPNTNAVNAAKAGAEKTARELRGLINKDDENGAKAKFTSITVDQLPYILEKDPTLLEALKDLVSPNTFKLALKNKLGFKGNTDTMSVDDTIAEMKELMKNKKTVNENKVRSEDALREASKAKPDILAAMSTLSVLANPANGSKPRASRVPNTTNGYSVTAKNGDQITFKISNGKVFQAVIQTVKNGKKSQLTVQENNFMKNDKTVANNNNTEILNYIQQHFPVK